MQKQGMDNQHERAGYWKDRVSKGVDINCYLVLECEAFSKIAKLAEKNGDFSKYIIFVHVLISLAFKFKVMTCWRFTWLYFFNKTF